MFLNWKNIQYNWTGKKKKKPFKAHTNFNLDFSIKVQFKNSHWPNFATLEQRHCQNLSL